MPIAPTSSEELIDLLRKSGIVPADKLAGLSDLSLPDDLPKAAATLTAQGYVTRFQAQQLLSGRHKGFKVGAYVIQDMLGRGGMGAVYLAEHTELHRKVAIKVLVPGRDEDQRLALERFIREARAAAALDHPNIVRIFDVARHNETPYLVMEYVDGQTLQQVLDRDGAIPYPTATEYIAQAAAGLQHAFEKGFIHRDIKPGNLIRDKSGTVKILDMGLARTANGSDNLTERLDNGAVVGTADFIAPEQALNQPNIDARADIYSLGATFFALIIGKPPFEGNTTQKLLQHQLRSAPRLVELDATLPKGLSAVVAKMLAKKPADRYQTPAEVIAALAPWMGNSARILAGISRTSLGQGADLQATLSEIAHGGSSRRLRQVAVAVDSEDEVDVERPERETGAVSAAVTTREKIRSPKKKKKKDDSKKKMMIYGGVAAGVVVLGIIAAVALSGGGSKDKDKDTAGALSRQGQEQQPPVVEGGKKDQTNKVDNTKGTKGSKTTPKTSPKVENPPPGPGREVVVYKFDPSEVESFRVRQKGGAVLDGKKGSMPRGVAFYTLKDDEAELECGKIDGATALVLTRFTGSGDTHVAFELERAIDKQGIGLTLKPDTDYEVHVRYKIDAAGTSMHVGVHTLSFKGGKNQAFGPTGDRWVIAKLPFHRGTEPMRMTIWSTGGLQVPVTIGSIEVIEMVPN